MKRHIMIVDGYNMIGSWPELVQLKKQEKLADARDLLLAKLSNYAKYQGIEIELVFDAQFVPGIQKTYVAYGVTVVFTKKDETADSYIERTTAERLNPLTHVSVATSDLAEQWMVFAKGALRISANELYKHVQKAEKKISQDAADYQFRNIRRHSPWNREQLDELSELREELSDT